MHCLPDALLYDVHYNMDSLSLGGDQLCLDNLVISTAISVWLDNHLGYKFPFPALHTPKTLETSTRL